MKLNGSFDSASGITVSPLERPCVRIVVANILHDFSFEICLGREDPSCDKVPLYFRKPYLDLVEPGTVGRSIVHVHIGVFAQEQLDEFGLMGGEIVGDDMDLFTLRLRTHQVGEEGHELGAGMTIGGFADDSSSRGIQCRIQRDGPVTVVRLFRAKEAGPDQAGRALGWRSFHRHRRPLHAPGASDTDQ